MKIKSFDSTGKQSSELELPKVFSSKIRDDLSWKLFEVDKYQNMFWYSNMKEAGKRHSASGTISHQRHQWKGHYGKGISRVPRKTMWRRGTQFFWIAAEVASTRGGRRVHGPSAIRAPIKMNKKESNLAFNSAIASTAHTQTIQNRYSSLSEKSIKQAPFVFDSIPTKTKEAISAIKLALGDLVKIAIKNKDVRAGKGTNRGRKYKSNAGLLIVTGNEEKVKLNAFDVKTVEELSISDLYPLGRLTLYTKQALKDLEERK